MNNSIKTYNFLQIASKTCRKCNQEKPLTEFRNDKGFKDGKKARCKMCLKINPDMPREIRCYYCREWFVQTQSSYKFCKPLCHNRYWNRNFRLSTNGTIYMKNYHGSYLRKSQRMKLARVLVYSGYFKEAVS